MIIRFLPICRAIFSKYLLSVIHRIFIYVSRTMQTCTLIYMNVFILKKKSYCSRPEGKVDTSCAQTNGYIKIDLHT